MALHFGNLRLGTTTKDYHKKVLDILTGEYPKYPKMKKGPVVDGIPNLAEKPDLLDPSVKFSSPEEFCIAVKGLVEKHQKYYSEFQKIFGQFSTEKPDQKVKDVNGFRRVLKKVFEEEFIKVGIENIVPDGTYGNGDIGLLQM